MGRPDDYGGLDLRRNAVPDRTSAVDAGLAGGWIECAFTGNPHVVVANFADEPQTVGADGLATLPPRVQDLVGGVALHLRVGLAMRTRQFVWPPCT